MSISMKSILAAAVAGLLANSAMAADGTINFSGEITAASCTITGGGGTSVAAGTNTITVPLGSVSIDSLNTGSAGGSIVAGKNINLNLDCGKTGTGLTTVSLQFEPTASMLHPDNQQVLATTGTATGVGIGVYDKNGTLVDLKANGAITSPLDKNPGKDGEGNDITLYSAELNLRAAFVKVGSVAPTAGTASASLPFTLNYN